MTDDLLSRLVYQLARARAEGRLPNVPGREHETPEERIDRWNRANPHDPVTWLGTFESWK